MKRPLTIVCLLLFCIAAVPQNSNQSFSDIRDSGNIFLAKCEPGHVVSAEALSTTDFCLGYMTGLADAVGMAMMPVTPSCPPGNVTPGQMKRIALKYMHDHPEKTHKAAPVLIFEAWAEAFPCPAKK
jgi:hypothetical protein